MDLIVSAIGNYLLSTQPMLMTFFNILGSLVVIMTAIDKIIPDEIDGGFSKKIFDLPILSNVVNFLLRFSILRNKKPGEE